MGYCCGVGVILTRMLEVQKMMFFATRVYLDGFLGVDSTETKCQNWYRVATELTISLLGWNGITFFQIFAFIVYYLRGKNRDLGHL